MNIAYNRDCLEAMREMPDNAFDLAVCDPPYGDALANESGGGTWNRFGGRFDKYKTNRPLAQQLPQERERETRIWQPKFSEWRGQQIYDLWIWSLRTDASEPPPHRLVPNRYTGTRRW